MIAAAVALGLIIKIMKTIHLLSVQVMAMP